VITRALNPEAEAVAGIKLDIIPREAERQVRLLLSVAEFYSLESLQAASNGVLSSFQFH
jgi:hypothetical protein